MLFLAIAHMNRSAHQNVMMANTVISKASGTVNTGRRNRNKTLVMGCITVI